VEEHEIKKILGLIPILGKKEKVIFRSVRHLGENINENISAVVRRDGACREGNAGSFNATPLGNAYGKCACSASGGPHALK